MSPNDVICPHRQQQQHQVNVIDDDNDETAADAHAEKKRNYSKMISDEAAGDIVDHDDVENKRPKI